MDNLVTARTVYCFEGDACMFFVPFFSCFSKNRRMYVVKLILPDGLYDDDDDDDDNHDPSHHRCLSLNLDLMTATNSR